MAKFDGLLYTPATDLNFISGIQSLKDSELNKMLEKLYELNESESGHKGRIKAVEKEIKNRSGNSTGLVNINRVQNDIELIERLYGDGMPYDKDRLEDAAKFYLAQTAQALFESGKIFLRIKAHEDHGGFMESLARIDVPSSTAHYAMAAVLKFGPNFHPDGNLGTSKLRMLTVFEEEDIKKYVDGGPLGSIPHDDVETMSKRELQEAIREERKKHQKDVETRERAIKQKETKINEMDELLRYQQPLSEKKKLKKLLKPNWKNCEKSCLVKFNLRVSILVKRSIS
ncbi:MAG: DUF3102 domain-containing protein [Treponema sp.]|jgi:hypothetical protein|nr:DUF3102 domain-containing protein [Treponema sp.]